MIRKATIRDVHSIEGITDSVLLREDSIEENGFLSLNPGTLFYKKIINKSKYCYVYEHDSSIVGFLIAYPNEFLDSNDDIQGFFINNPTYKKFVYVFQTAVNPRFHKRGIGRKMYEALFNDACGHPIMLVTSKKPHNKASEQFHLKLGFNKIGQLTRQDMGISIIYERPVND